MSTNVVTATLAAFACAAVVSAQAPQTPQVPAPPSPAAAPTQQAPEAKSATADSLIVTGCIERRADPSGATPGTVGTTGAVGGAKAPAFILTKVMKPTGTSGASSAATPAASYQLDADDSKLSGHVGHKVEITGMLADRSNANASASAGASSAAPRLKVESVKMIAANCTE